MKNGLIDAALVRGELLDLRARIDRLLAMVETPPRPGPRGPDIEARILAIIDEVGGAVAVRQLHRRLYRHFRRAAALAETLARMPDVETMIARPEGRGHPIRVAARRNVGREAAVQAVWREFGVEISPHRIEIEGARQPAS